MGASHTVPTITSFGSFHTRPILLPIPDEFGESILNWPYTDPRDEDSHVKRFKAFANSYDEVNSMIYDVSNNVDEYFVRVLQHFYETDFFKTYFKELPLITQDGVSKPMKIKYDEISHDVHADDDTRDKLNQVASSNHEYNGVILIQSPGESNNAALINFKPNLNTLYFTLFDPMFPMNLDLIRDKLDHIKMYLKYMGGFGRVDIVVDAKGGSIIAMQTEYMLSAQWSLLMCLVYLLNTPLDATRDTAKVIDTEIFNTLARNRHIVMPLWLFFLYKSRGKEDLDRYRSARLASMFEDLAEGSEMDIDTCNTRLEYDCDEECEWIHDKCVKILK